VPGEAAIPPVYITTQLLSLASDPKYIQILTKYTQQDMTYSNQRSIKSQLAEDLKAIAPTFAVEDEFPCFLWVAVRKPRP
jgi:hypothetical protein